MKDAGVKAVETVLAFEIHFITAGHFIVERIGAQIVAIKCGREIRVPDVINLRDARQRRPSGSLDSVDQV